MNAEKIVQDRPDITITMSWSEVCNLVNYQRLLKTRASAGINIPTSSTFDTLCEVLVRIVD